MMPMNEQRSRILAAQSILVCFFKQSVEPDCRRFTRIAQWF